MRGNVGAHLRYLFGEVSEECGAGVAVGIFVEADVVDEGPRVGLVGEVSDAVEAVGGVVVAEAVPDEKGERKGFGERGCEGRCKEEEG